MLVNPSLPACHVACREDIGVQQHPRGAAGHRPGQRARQLAFKGAGVLTGMVDMRIERAPHVTQTHELREHTAICSYPGS